MNTQPDHYATLHVTPDATPREIARAYRALLRTHHPDTRQAADDGGTPSAGDVQELHAIMQAYVVLSDPGKRATYDRERRSSAPSSDRGTPVKVRVHRTSKPAQAQTSEQSPLAFGPPRWEPLPRSTRLPRRDS